MKPNLAFITIICLCCLLGVAITYSFITLKRIDSLGALASRTTVTTEPQPLSSFSQPPPEAAVVIDAASATRGVYVNDRMGQIIAQSNPFWNPTLQNNMFDLSQMLSARDRLASPNPANAQEMIRFGDLSSTQEAPKPGLPEPTLIFPMPINWSDFGLY